ncbi:LysE family transporter [Helicobacter saguini]|uniref:LysE family transporter n=1 Tax=Helicobacter saguini TaxID=1548018 RepID=A0A6B0HP82_9HELI|nr:LysE family translocator [Helicobacter saguini]MWV61852.1 LysE family transporter [Helicobacter saguini]MWV67473.1 LysE family transporter [Helicobacter saguini]MWV69824.1 LysE family transporter [Helicobacter saguini]MWV72958.1 LysE family transporter [Helicobacter saguini]
MDFTYLFLVAFVGAVTPGPDILLVINSTLKSGVLAGLKALAGIATGWLIFLSVIYFGLSFIFSGEIMQVILSLVGGAYLLYISILLAKSKQEKVIESVTLDSMQNLDSKKTIESSILNSKNINNPNFYIRGFIVNISNPKAILFFSVIIAPYMQGGDILLSLIVLFFSLASGFLGVIILCAFFRKFINDRIFFIIDKVCGVIFFLFSIYLFINAFNILKSF